MLPYHWELARGKDILAQSLAFLTSALSYIATALDLTIEAIRTLLNSLAY